MVYVLWLGRMRKFRIFLFNLKFVIVYGWRLFNFILEKFEKGIVCLFKWYDIFYFFFIRVLEKYWWIKM